MKDLRLMTAFMLIGATFLMPNAAATSCSVSTEVPTCEFTCIIGDVISVSAGSTSDFYDASISGSCGGESANCTAPREQSCSAESEGQATSPGNGTCEFNGAGTGSCGASGGQEECTKIAGVCCPPSVCQNQTAANGLQPARPVDPAQLVEMRAAVDWTPGSVDAAVALAESP